MQRWVVMQQTGVSYSRTLLQRERHTGAHTQGGTGEASVCTVITSSQRGGELRESEAPGEKRIMGKDWGAALRPPAEREDA